MKFIFFGSPRFASLVLEKLVKANLSPALVVTSPDRPAGRKQIITAPAAKALALTHNIKVTQPENPSALISQLSVLKPDFFIIAAYAHIISPEILNIPKFGTIGVHPSLLPLYRGASPIQNAILNGELISGISLYLVDAKMDHGAILSQTKASISGLNYTEVEAKLAHLGGQALIKLIPDFLAGNIKPTAQNHTAASFTKKFQTADATISLSDLKQALAGNITLATSLYQKILAFNPEPGAFVINSAGLRIKLLNAKLENNQLVITELQPTGKKSTSQYSPNLLT